VSEHATFPAGSPAICAFNLLRMCALGVNGAIARGLQGGARVEDILVVVTDATSSVGKDLADLAELTAGDIERARAQFEPFGAPPTVVIPFNRQSMIPWLAERSTTMASALGESPPEGNATVLVVAFGTAVAYQRGIPEFTEGGSSP
jgi:hypothetical protein